MVERLGFGEKRGFETGDQLIQMVGGRFFFDHNMQAGTGQCNAEHRGLLAGRTVDLRGGRNGVIRWWGDRHRPIQANLPNCDKARVAAGLRD